MCMCAQAWVSPWQVAHVLSIIATIKKNMPEDHRPMPEAEGGASSIMQPPPCVCNTDLPVDISVCLCLQAWVSPWQVAHVLSIIATIKKNMPDVDPLMPEAEGGATPAAAKPATVLNTQLRVTATIEVPILNILCLVCARCSLCTCR